MAFSTISSADHRPNTDPETGVAYGYISANALDQEVVGSLLYGRQARDLSYERALEEAGLVARNLAEDAGVTESEYDDWVDAHVEKEMEDYQCDEPEIEGEYEGVSYAVSWLGGALNFFILRSPVTTDRARRASPCVPGAGILDVLDGSEHSYDVPADWRAEQ